MKEQDLYPRVKRYIENTFNCKAIQDRVTFTFLKNWKIDVVGAVKSDSGYDIIAVEVKSVLRPDTFIQAISQAEMYQRISKIAYIAFPEEEILKYKEDYEEDWKKMQVLAESKGIGILSIGRETCKIEVDAREETPILEVHRTVINQIEEYTLNYTFPGFNKKDYDYFLGEEKERGHLVKKKIKLFLNTLKSKIENNTKDFPSINASKLYVEMGHFYPKYCWCYISQEPKKLLIYNAHFTIAINGEGISVCIKMENPNVISKFIKGAEKDLNTLHKILQELKEGYSLKIFKRIPPPPERFRQWSKWKAVPVCEFHTPYIEQRTLEYAIKTIKSLKLNRVAVRLYCGEYTRDQEFIYKEELIEKIFQSIKEVQPFYSWIRRY
ncbi:MAG: hypothetical protein QXK74_07305 [Candidatus Nitrosocaldaceae archaeon]